MPSPTPKPVDPFADFGSNSPSADPFNSISEDPFSDPFNQKDDIFKDGDGGLLVGALTSEPADPFGSASNNTDPFGGSNDSGGGGGFADFANFNQVSDTN